MKFLINVSQYDIETAERRNSHRCMVANAFLRSTDGAFLRGEVDVDGLPGLGWCIGITPVDGRLPRVLPLRKIEGGERLALNTGMSGHSGFLRWNSCATLYATAIPPRGMPQMTIGGSLNLDK